MDDTFEQRLARLERIVEELQQEIRRPRGQPGRDDWRRTIGTIADDPVAKEMIDEGLRIGKRSDGSIAHRRNDKGRITA